VAKNINLKITNSIVIYMPVDKIKKFLFIAEEFVEDLILILLSIVIIVLSLSALTVLGTNIPVEVSERVEKIAELLPYLTFLAKAEYFASLVFPWVIMLIGILLFRELWLLRRAIERLEFKKLLELSEKTTKKVKKR